MKKFPLPLILIACVLRGTLFLGAGLVLVQPCAGTSGGFLNTGSMATTRWYFTATLLPDGKVLAAAGYSDLASAELYDPASGTWAATGSLNTARYLPTATLLPNGMVLVAGGSDSNYNPTAGAELYDPALGTWTTTGSLNSARTQHTATLLPNGMVLITGGLGTDGLLASAELYDPASGTWVATGSLNTARVEHTATLLPGMVLVAGGEDSSFTPAASAELYDLASGTWAATSSLNTARTQQTATLLPNGNVLVAGGFDSSSSALASAELYDPASGTWEATGSLNTARFQHTATLLPNGKVLAVAGYLSLASAELYDPASGTWAATGSLNTGRSDHTATLLSNGNVLVAGGQDNTGLLASAELFDPAATPPAITSANKTTFTVGTNSSFTVTTTGIPTPTLSESGALPSGVTFNPATGVLGGTPAAGTGGFYPITFTASNGVPPDAMQGFTLTVSTVVNQAPAITSPNNTTFTVGSNGGFTVTTTGIPTPTLSESGALPSGVTFNPATGVLSGTPAAGTGGVYPITFTASNGVPPDAMQGFTLTVSLTPVITSPLTASGTVSLPFSYQFEATGATSLGVDESTLPPGLTFDSTLLAIVGNPTVEGTFQVGLSASNLAGTTNATLVLTVQPFPSSGPVIMSITSATGRTGSPFAFQVITSGGSSAARVTQAGLPAGLSIDSVTGEISGTPTTDGSFSVTLSATEAGITNTATLQLTFTSDPAVPVIVSPISALIFPGLPFRYTILAPTSDSTDPVTYTEIGLLPLGLGLDQTTGIISGIPQARVGLQPTPSLAGGVVTNVQLFACNSTGCAAQGLFFLLPTGAANISTRLSVGTVDNVLIGGFITQGNAPMKLIVRGIGPSLAQLGLTGVLANPYLELHSVAATIASNDDWMVNLDPTKDPDQSPAIIATGLAPGQPPFPPQPLESAILAVLDPGSYTAIMSGKNNTIGVGLVEVYNLGAASMDVSSEAHLGNISTRGNVQTGDNVMIGGFINQGSVPIQVLVRGIGPSLAQFGVSGVLANPILVLHHTDEMGKDVVVATNDDWMTDQQADIMNTGLQPTNALESAILITLPVGKGAYTAIVKGANGTTGVGLVEAYFGDPCLEPSCP